MYRGNVFLPVENSHLHSLSKHGYMFRSKMAVISCVGPGKKYFVCKFCIGSKDVKYQGWPKRGLHASLLLLMEVACKMVVQVFLSIQVACRHARRTWGRFERFSEQERLIRRKITYCMWTEVRSNQIRNSFFIILLRGYSVASYITPPEVGLAGLLLNIPSGPRKFVWDIKIPALK